MSGSTSTATRTPKYLSSRETTKSCSTSAHQIDHEEELGVELADVLLRPKARRRCQRRPLLPRPVDGARPRMYSPVVLTQLSTRIMQRDQQQVAIAEDQPEGARAGPTPRLRETVTVSWCSPLVTTAYSPVAAGIFAVVNRAGMPASQRRRSRASTMVAQQRGQRQQPRGHQQQLRHSEQRDQSAGHDAPTTAPSEAPKATIGNSRSPWSLV